MARIYNFSSGPSILPLSALEEASRELVDYKHTGMSLIEMSHRGKIYDQVHNEAIALVKELLAVPDDYTVLFIQGGATLQFGMIPMAFLQPGRIADFVVTGTWVKKAFEDAKCIGEARIIWDGAVERYRRIPTQKELNFTTGAEYVYICSNETIDGIQWPTMPDTGGIPLIVDMSSDILSRPVEWDKVTMLFAGTQKNLAPAGMAVVIMKNELLAKARKDLPAYLRYDLHAKENSLYNTPPTFTVWMTTLTLKWVKSIGGMPQIEKLRDQKAKLIYDAIDASGGYYMCPVDKSSRSKMNIVWRLHNEQLEEQFVKEAEKEGLSGLKGHRSVGGLRASIYNAMPVEGVVALVEFMNHFMQKNG
ncbi:MAG: 3-phosphoserine/phosphohydroxythreonine transaminase [Spirochaetes bacterium]|nr:3-phosphoserine/phosphohydroxythreonine transaminase [Spirochaetota bacterium]